MPSTGRPRVLDQYIKPNLERIRKLKQDGYTDEQIARVIGVSYETLRRYKKTFSPLFEALKKGKEDLILELEDTLYRRALGKCKTKTTKKYIEEVNGIQKQKIEETVQELPPDVGALCFSLKNLAPDKWKEVRLDNNFNEMQKALDNFKSFSERMDGVSQEDMDNVPEDNAV